MSDIQNNIFNQQMNNPQQSPQAMNFQFPQNPMMNEINQINNINPSNMYQFQQQLNPNNNFNNYNNINMNQKININNNIPNPNLNNMNNININFDNLEQKIQSQIQSQNPNKINTNMNINQNNININNKINIKDTKIQQEEQISNKDTKTEKNTNIINNNAIPVSKPNNKEEKTQNPDTKKLENKFSFLYRIDDNAQYQNQKQVMEKEKYESQVKKIADFDTIDEFWSIFQHLRKPDSCHAGIEYFMFKEPIKPMWEDENNKNGGRFSIKLKHGYTTIIWEEMIFALIGGILPKEMKDEINGIVVTSRKDFNTLQIWFRNYDDKITADLEQCIRDLLVIPDEVKLEKRQFNKKDYGNNNNNSNNNKSSGYYNREYNNNNNNNNNYRDNGHGSYRKEHRKNKNHFNRK